jgi:DNA-binding NarL/FixJ family response regulator
VRVVIGEDEALMRAGLTLVLEDGGIDVVAVTDDASRLLDLALEHRPDVVITDIRMPPTHTHDGLEAALRVRDADATIAVLVLSQFVQTRYALELVGARAAGVGYLLKQRVVDARAFLADLRTVADGGTVLDPEVAVALVDRARRRVGLVGSLTPRQRDVLALMAEGRSNAAIARRLEISERTVVQHVSLVYDQLGISADDDHHRRVLAVVRYLADEPATPT